MKALFVLGIFVVLAVGSHSFVLQSEAGRLLPPLDAEPSSHETKTFLTRVDHFRPQDRRVARFVTNLFILFKTCLTTCTFFVRLTPKKRIIFA